MSVQNEPDAKIEQPTDLFVKITTTNICGSDLQMYEGRTDVKSGMVLGYENTGEVAEIGKPVAKIKVVDCVSCDLPRALDDDRGWGRAGTTDCLLAIAPYRPAKLFPQGKPKRPYECLKRRSPAILKTEREEGDVARSNCFEDKNSKPAIRGIGSCFGPGRVGIRRKPCEAAR